MKKTLLFLLIFPCLIAACSDENNKGNVVPEKPYDPDKPLEVSDFEPKTGGVATQVIINGSNFGTDASKLKVYFNSKQAKVINTIGDLAYVLVPKRPGDTCSVSVTIGKDSMIYNDPFFYKTTVQVSTIAGTPHEGEQDGKDGTLLEARFKKPYYLAVDKEKNIFIGEWPQRVRLINEEKNEVITLLNTGAGDNGDELVSGCTDHNNETVYFPKNGGAYYYEFDPEKRWIARRIIPEKNPGDEFDLNGKYSMTACALDSMLYTITTNGELVKIDPKTRIAKLVRNDILRDEIPVGIVQAYLCFHPTETYMLYFVNPSSMTDNDTNIQGTDRIYRMDIRDPSKYEKYAGTIKGYRDGNRLDAQFNNPCQICFNEEGEMFVADTDNFCVRKISVDGIVSTFAGRPGEKGYLDGDPDEAMFDRFWGMKIDPDGTLYIADYYNHCVRKLTNE
jgi:hypothetical protein